MINAPQYPGTQVSILNQSKRRKVQAGKAFEDTDEAPHSGATSEHMQRFFDALQHDDEHEQHHAFGKVVEAWRADKAAGGLPVYAHAPLPNIFANAVVHAMRNVPGATERVLADGISARLEPGIRSAVLKQLGETTKAQALDAMRQTWKAGASAEPRSLFERARNGDAESVGGSLNPTTLEFRPDRDGPLRAETLPWNGERLEATPLQGMPTQQPPQSAHDPWWKDKPLLPEEGGEAGLDPTPKSGPFARPQVDPLDTAPPGYEYEEWQKAPNPRTAIGSLLVPPSRLTQRQQRNLNDRTWISPTGRSVGGGRLKGGRGYFGADRIGSGPPRHGGYDAPYKFPWEADVDESGKPRSREVRLPTRVLRATFEEKDSNNAVINRLSFDLGDGITLELLHVTPTPALRKAIADAKRTGRPLQLDAGVLLGEIDAGHDHTHVQIIVTQPNGERWTVDPTDFMEKKARTFSRKPMRDDWEWWIDRSIDGYNWVQRQLE